MVVTLQRMGMPAGRHFRKGGGSLSLMPKVGHEGSGRSFNMLFEDFARWT